MVTVRECRYLLCVVCSEEGIIERKSQVVFILKTSIYSGIHSSRISLRPNPYRISSNERPVYKTLKFPYLVVCLEYAVHWSWCGTKYPDHLMKVTGDGGGTR